MRQRSPRPAGTAGNDTVAALPAVWLDLAARRCGRRCRRVARAGDVTASCLLLGSRTTRDGVEWYPVHPPTWLTRGLLDRFEWQGVRKLEGVIEGPVLRPDGSVLQQPGYDPVSGLFYAPNERFEPIPEHPEESELTAALDRLRDAVAL